MGTFGFKFGTGSDLKVWVSPEIVRFPFDSYFIAWASKRYVLIKIESIGVFFRPSGSVRLPNKSNLKQTIRVTVFGLTGSGVFDVSIPNNSVVFAPKFPKLTKVVSFSPTFRYPVKQLYAQKSLAQVKFRQSATHKFANASNFFQIRGFNYNFNNIILDEIKSKINY